MEASWLVGSSPESSPAPREAIPLETVIPGTKSAEWNLHVFVGVCTIVVAVMMIVACGVFIRIRINNFPTRFQPLPSRTSLSSNVSPDFLDGMSKLKQSLINYRLEELRIGTDDFVEACVIGRSVYRCRIGGFYLAVEKKDRRKPCAMSFTY